MGRRAAARMMAVAEVVSNVLLGPLRTQGGTRIVRTLPVNNPRGARHSRHRLTTVKAGDGACQTRSGMSRCLVIYYSWTGNTAKVARAIAEALSADLEEIREVKPRAGALAHARRALDTLFKRTPRIEPGLHDPAGYQMVVVGCPVWAQDVAAPMTAWLQREKGKAAGVACFCTEGGVGGEKVLARMAEIWGVSAVANLIVTEPQLESGEWRRQADAFADEVRQRLRR